ncbi:IniB N-terminal domain-containing protein [Gordonia sp. CPCC 205333]|uniref:IniB N-terminal domain-containing protein n=1 Tax=Gordonia sp. CPCC 205333 TaxID=3140790 RepID=UPI003AF4011A
MAPSSLLDFITTLVHDPDAAAAYRADPQSALSAANLHDVTTADVDHLIPVVAESSNVGTTSGSIWSASNAAHSFDAAGSAFDPPINTQASVVVDHAVGANDSPFDPFAVPDVDSASADAAVPDDTASAQISYDGTPLEQTGFIELPDAPADPIWPEQSSSDGFGFDGHEHSTASEHAGFDDL